MDFLYLLCVIILLGVSFATVNYIGLTEEQTDNLGFVHLFMVENESGYSCMARYIEDLEAPFYVSKALDYVGQTDGIIPALQLTLPEGTHNFYLGAYLLTVEVKAGMITPVSISMDYYSSDLYGPWPEIIPYIHPAVEYSSEWVPDTEESIAAREGYDNPAVFIINNAWRVTNREIDKVEFDARVKLMAETVPLSDEELDVYIRAINILLAYQAVAALEFTMVRLGEKYMETATFLKKYNNQQ